MHRLFLYCL